MCLSNRLLLALLLGLTACASSPSYPPAPSGFYRVQPGDTLYSVSRKHGQSVASLQRWNTLKDTSAIQAGQLLRVTPPSGASAQPRPSSRPPVNAPRPAPSAKPAVAVPALRWPADGRLLAGYNSRTKGLEIAGQAGDPVRAAAAGKVVYVGHGIRAYGNLVIVKHNEDYLSTYAHNQKLLVKEGESVRQGQPIATMGSSGTDRVKLNFGLRYRGQSMDPAPYLKR